MRHMATHDGRPCVAGTFVHKPRVHALDGTITYQAALAGARTLSRSLEASIRRKS